MWEGMLQCLKWWNFDNLQIYMSFIPIQRFTIRNVSVLKKNNCFGVSSKNLSKAYFFSEKAFTPFYFTRGFYNENGKISSFKRIGPHNIEIISIIVGSTLGDNHLERRKNGVGTRILF
uniref:Uncharacterized protein n=1 Tax=Mutinus fleischeri TaxID=2218478 RepID=A0A8K1VE62_9AGAM|nr:hypothetical protein [Mutinus fleischeri]